MRRHYGYFGEGAAAAAGASVRTASQAAGDPTIWGANWNQPTSNTTVDVNGTEIPYYLAKPGTGADLAYGPDTGVGPDGIPYYLRAPGEEGLPAWVKPVAIGAAILVGLTVVGIVSWKT